MNEYSQDYSKLYKLCVAFELERLALSDNRLAPFRRNSTTWELLLRITKKDLNIQQVIQSLETNSFGYSSLVRFISLQLQDGRLVAVNGSKRSEKILKPSMGVLNALHRLVESQEGSFERRQDNASSQ